MKRTTIFLMLLFSVILTHGAIIKLTDGTKAIVNVITVTDKGALVQAEGMEPVFIDTPDIEWLAIDERCGSGGFGNGILLTNGLRTYAKSFEITEKSGYIDSVHGMVLVGGINDIRAIDYTTFSNIPPNEVTRKPTKYTQINVTKESVRTAKTTDDNVFEFEKVQCQNDVYVFEIKTIKIMAKVSMIKEVNLFEKDFEKFPAFLRTNEGTTVRCSVTSYQGDTLIVQTPVYETLRILLTDVKEFQKNFEQTQVLIPKGIVASFDSGSEMVLTKSPDFWLIGRLEKTPDGNLQLTNVVSNIQANKIRVQRLPFVLKWKFKTGGAIHSSPAIGPDGTIYVGSYDGNLYALNPDVRPKWKFQTGDQIRSSAAVGSDGTVYIGSWDGYVYAIEPDGKLKWKFQTQNKICASTPSIGADNTIYVGSFDNYLYAINSDGKLKWRFKSDGGIGSSPTLSTDGTLYFTSHDGYLYAIDLNVKLKWKFSIGDTWCSPSIGFDNVVYVGNIAGVVYCITPDGKLKWKFQTNGSVESAPVTGIDDTIYVGSFDGNLYALNNNGKLKWKFQTGDKLCGPSVAVGSDGTIFVTSWDKNIYAITSEGKLKWKFQTENGIAWSSPTINTDGTIYVGSFDNYLYAIQTTSFGLADTPWPTFKGNLRNTGVYGEK